MKKNKNEFDNYTIDALKFEYVKLCFGAMIYDAKTEYKRNKISEEIERRENNK